MKTLKDHVILYDAECPMCKVYTHAFTTSGMLDKTGRAPYQQIPESACPVVDRQRAVNEIALVNTVNSTPSSLITERSSSPLQKGPPILSNPALISATG